jgi:hypothetical protein
MTTDFPGTEETILQWLLDPDPAIRWQVMQDLRCYKSWRICEAALRVLKWYRARD